MEDQIDDVLRWIITEQTKTKTKKIFHHWCAIDGATLLTVKKEQRANIKINLISKRFKDILYCHVMSMQCDACASNYSSNKLLQLSQLGIKLFCLIAYLSPSPSSQ